MSTPNLAISHIAASQDQKEVTANAGLDALDGAVAGLAEIDVTNNATPASSVVTPVMSLKLTGAQGAGKTLTLPSKKHLYFVVNACTGGFDTTIKCSVSGATVTSANGNKKLIYADGTDVVALS